MIDLGRATNIEVIERKLSLLGKRVIDIGCGGMALSRALAKTVDQVLAVDPDPVQAKLNRSAKLLAMLIFEKPTRPNCLLNRIRLTALSSLIRFTISRQSFFEVFLLRLFAYSSRVVFFMSSNRCRGLGMT